jgi:hypothetical protein
MSRGDQEIHELHSKESIKDERKKWKNINNVEGRKNYRKLRHLLTGNAENAMTK